MFGTFAQAARDNKPATYSKPHHDVMLGFWNPGGAKDFLKKPAKYVCRRPCEIEAILNAADEAVNAGLMDKARDLLNSLK
jgi:hypothetical protein